MMLPVLDLHHAGVLTMQSSAMPSPSHPSNVLTLIRRCPPDSDMAGSDAELTLALTADERTRSRHFCNAEDGEPVYLNLPRGTVLRHGDLLEADQGDRRVRVVARPEPVMTVTGRDALHLLKAAYHLGNRHVALEIAPTYLRLTPDAVLKHLLEHLGLQVMEEVTPFQPEAGAYGHHH